MKAIITGASRGIGKAMAEAFSQQNIDLVLLARDEKALSEFKTKLEHQNCQVVYAAIDLSEKNSVAQLETLLPEIIHADILVNNLGFYSQNEASQIEATELQKQLNINLFPAISMTQMILPHFRIKKAGQIINIGSVLSLDAASFASNYSISKHALKAWNDALKEEVRSEGIKVSALYPGAVNTSSWDGQTVNREKMIQAEDIAALVCTMVQLKSMTLVDEIRISPLDLA